MDKKIELKVGMFMLVALFLLIGTILLLGGDKMIFSRYYNLNAYFSSVQGLAQGSIVSLAGVKVGNITEIDFKQSENLILVKMRIEQGFQARITRGSKAEIKTQGALGDKYVYIEPGLSNEPPLQEGESLDTLTGNDIIDALSGKGQDVKQVFRIISELHKLAVIINADGRSEKIVTNLAQATEKLNKLMDQSTLLITEMKNKDPENKTRESLNHLASILGKIDQGKGTLGALINDPVVYERLKLLLGDSPRTKHVKSLIRGAIQQSDETN